MRLVVLALLAGLAGTQALAQSAPQPLPVQPAAPVTAPVASPWQTSCDSGSCRLARLSDDKSAYLFVLRRPGEGFIAGFVTSAIADRERPANLRLDGRMLATLAPARDYQAFTRPDTFALSADVATRVLQAMPTGSALAIEYLDILGAPHAITFPLDGLAAALDAIDTPERLRERGVAARPDEIVAKPKAELILEAGIPPRLLERHRQATTCEAVDQPSGALRGVEPVVGILSATAIVYAIPCTVSNGEPNYRVWQLETGEIGGIIPLYFALFDRKFGWRGTDLIGNVRFDPRDKRLVAAGRGRGTSGSCPWAAAWKWTEFAFALESFALAPDCASGRDPATYQRVFPGK